MPALPGAHHICVACGDCASFQTSACSRPPDPMTRSFMKIFHELTKMVPTLKVKSAKSGGERAALQTLREIEHAT